MWYHIRNMFSSTKIRSVVAREILDSRGNPTVACRVTLASGATAEERPTVNSKSDGSYKQTEIPVRKLLKIRVTKSPFVFKDKNVFIGVTPKEVDFVGK